MRTTLELDDDLMLAAREVSHARNQSIGRTVSDWVRHGMQPQGAPTIEMRGGIPVIVHQPGATPVTSELVRALAEDE